MMTDAQTKERYRHLANMWGVKPEEVDEASKFVFHNTKTKYQQDFEKAMQKYIQVQRAKMGVKEKIQHKEINLQFIEDRVSFARVNNFPTPKYLEFCRLMLKNSFKVKLYEAVETRSKYITIIRGSRQYKVRFSNHKPNYRREKSGESDFYVGVTNTGVRTTEDAIGAVSDYFKVELQGVDYSYN